eukprot:CCRYP_007516-RB/>CCRYP_007516-RB protein AED:0.03 eAED:0.03 QI:34/1/1/1/1/0.66/3/565/597
MQWEPYHASLPHPEKSSCNKSRTDKIICSPRETIITETHPLCHNSIIIMEKVAFPILNYNIWNFPSAANSFQTILKALIPIFFIVTAYFILIQGARSRHNNAKLPKYDAIPSSTVKHVASKDVLRNLSGKIDVAIVGSGIGALSNAVCLARQGFKVAVFEQNETVGGCTHTFEKEGYEFDVGVHYVGGFGPMVRKMYDELSDGQLRWTKLDRVYDVIYNGKTKERIEMTDDYDENRKKLTHHFGVTAESWRLFDRKKTCAKFWSLVVFQLKLWHPIVLRIAWPFVVVPYRHYALRPTRDVLKECGMSSKAIGALTYHYGDHGVPPHRCPFFMTALLDTHYKGGGFFPRGGSRSIAKCFTASIERRGGYVYALSPVEEILTKKTFLGAHAAVGVRIRGVDVMVKKCVISDAGVLRTFGLDSAGSDQAPLINFKVGAAQRALLHNKKSYPTIDAVTPCMSDLSLFIGLDRTDAQLNLPAQNIWHLHDWDHDSAWKAAMNGASPLDSTADKTPFLFISNESAKDPDFCLRHPGKSTSEVFALVKYSLFEKWAHTEHESRDKEYLELKERLTESYLDAFYLHFPQAKGHVVFTSLGTPLTM